MSTAGALEALFVRDLEMTRGAVHLYAQTLREGGLLPKGKPGSGAPHLNSQHGAAFLLALTSGASVSSIVTSTRALMGLVRARQIHAPFEDNDRAVLNGLSLADARTAGAALASTIDDMRSGNFSNWGGELTFNFRDSCDFLSVTAVHPSHNQASVIQFKRSGKAKRKEQLVGRITYLDQRLLLNLAEALGPLEDKPVKKK